MSFRQSVAAVFAFIALLYAFAFTYPSTELQRDIETGDAMRVGAATCNQSICNKVCESGKNMKTILTAYLACFSYLSCACGPIPSPTPPEPSVGGQTSAGGSTSAGGASFGGRGGTGSLGGSSGVGGASSAVDGFALCVAATKASADRQRQATDNGMSISTLATSLCEPVQVQQCYARGVCQ